MDDEEKSSLGAGSGMPFGSGCLLCQRGGKTSSGGGVAGGA